MWTELLYDYGDLIPVKDFILAVQYGAFIDDDGYGYPVKDDLMEASIAIVPSRLTDIPEGTTHIIWYNK